VSETPFVDHYEVLQLSQNADSDTLERVFRLMAKRYHPDNPDSGSEDTFREVHEAYEVLTDPARRAAFDVQYDKHRSMQWQVFDQEATRGSHQEDQKIFSGVLSLLYAARRSNPESGGVGSIDLERKLGVPREHLEFPFWYMKKKGWIEILQSGQYAITIDGIEEVLTREATAPVHRMLTEGEQAEAARAAAEG
jgi:curved DNA-binding protein CbpA